MHLYRFGSLSRLQLQRLFFSSVHRCNRRLRQLFDAGLVYRHCPTLPGGTYWGTEILYTLGAEAADVLVSQRPAPPEEIVRRCRSCRTPTFLAHSLAVAEVYLALKEALQTLPLPSWHLARFLVENECWDEYEVRKGEEGAWTKRDSQAGCLCPLARRCR